MSNSLAPDQGVFLSILYALGLSGVSAGEGTGFYISVSLPLKVYAWSNNVRKGEINLGVHCLAR